MEVLLRICDRFKCLPSQALDEDANVLRMLSVEALARREEVTE